MTKQKRRELAFRYSNEAIVKHIDQCAVTIVGTKGSEPKEIGSGTCVQIGMRYFVATAAHVIDGRSKNTITLMHHSKPGQFWSPVIGIGQRTDPLDIAWLELPADAIGDIHPVALSRLEPGQGSLEHDLVTVYGSPTDLIDRALLEKKFLRAIPIGYLTETLEPSKCPSDAIPERDIFVEFPEDGNIQSITGEPVTLPAPYGISGGGIWALHINDGGIWSPSSAKLIGIEHRWLSTERWLRGTQIQHWLTMLRDVAKDEG